MAEIIRADTIGHAWEKSLKLFRNPETLNRFDSQRGPCIEVEDLTIAIAKPLAEPQIADLYPSEFRPFIEVYADGFLGRNDTQGATIAQRLYRWPRRPKNLGAHHTEQIRYLDQFEKAKHVAIEEPASRYNIIGFWDPDIDTEISNPVSPLVASFRIRGGLLHSTLCARSIDGWLGALPMMIGFTRLHARIAQGCSCGVGFITLFVLSYHVYEMDLPAIPGVFGL